MAFVLAYLTALAIVVAILGSFFTVVSTRNRAVILVAQLFNIVANPLTTLTARIRAAAAMATEVVPDTAFAPGVVRRMLYGVTFLVLVLVDFALSAGRLSVAFGIDGEQLPVDVGWTAAMGWVAVAGFFAAMSIELRGIEPGHPWDELTDGARRLLRRVSDLMVVVVALSGLVFYLWGSLAAAGSYPLLPVVVFMSGLGLALIVASGIAFWACHDAWTTIYGVLLIGIHLLLRLLAVLPEMAVISLRRVASLIMAAIDLPMLGFALPLLLWWSNSRLGKALGLPPIEEPIEWPAVGVVESADERGRRGGLVVLDSADLEEAAA
ncbi:MAG: hypothetical protein KC482_01330 [Dehalococcoidia bacterium]|nr:hypothetical protein [Dehalococcoidia bacterium]